MARLCSTWASILPVNPTTEILQHKQEAGARKLWGRGAWRSCGSLWPAPLTGYSTEGPGPASRRVCHSLGIDVPGLERGDTAGLPRRVWDKQPSYLRPRPPSAASRGPVPWAPVTSGLRFVQMFAVSARRKAPSTSRPRDSSAEGTRGTRTLCRSIVWSPGLGHREEQKA